MTKREKSLLTALANYDAAAEKFINKVKTGRAISSETYADLRQALANSKEARKFATAPVTR
jgi:hypothetical protein